MRSKAPSVSPTLHSANPILEYSSLCAAPMPLATGTSHLEFTGLSLGSSSQPLCYTLMAFSVYLILVETAWLLWAPTLCIPPQDLVILQASGPAHVDSPPRPQCWPLEQQSSWCPVTAGHPGSMLSRSVGPLRGSLEMCHLGIASLQDLCHVWGAGLLLRLPE